MKAARLKLITNYDRAGKSVKIIKGREEEIKNTLLYVKAARRNLNEGDSQRLTTEGRAGAAR